MGYQIRITRGGSGGWVDGTINGYRFQAKVFDEPSRFGIHDGRTSKLMIWDEAERQRARNIFSASIMNYDRGWDIEPEPEHTGLVEALVSYLEKLPASE